MYYILKAVGLKTYLAFDSNFGYWWTEDKEEARQFWHKDQINKVLHCNNFVYEVEIVEVDLA